MISWVDGFTHWLLAGLVLLFALCVAFNALFLERAMYTVWQKLLHRADRVQRLRLVCGTDLAPLYNVFNSVASGIKAAGWKAWLRRLPFLELAAKPSCMSARPHGNAIMTDAVVIRPFIGCMHRGRYGCSVAADQPPHEETIHV